MSILDTGLETVALPPLSIRVRLAGPRDCEALSELLDDKGENGREHAREQVLTWLETAGTTLLVAQSELGVLAVAVLLTRIMPIPGGGLHKVVEVDNLVVRADMRGQRIGRRLLAACVEWSRQRRAAQVEVMVGDTNRDARRFYESFGFANAVDRLVLAA
jgi:GNAT superfamily N-acetyltransferase